VCDQNNYSTLNKSKAHNNSKITQKVSENLWAKIKYILSSCYPNYLFIEPRANVTVEISPSEGLCSCCCCPKCICQIRAAVPKIKFEYPLLCHLFSAKAVWQIRKLEIFLLQKCFKACVCVCVCVCALVHLQVQCWDQFYKQNLFFNTPLTLPS
jgi:hypothetical protein